MSKHPACLATNRGWVEITDDSAYRYITDPFVKEFLNSNSYSEKINEFWIAASISDREPVHDYDKSKISICASYEVEKIEHITYYPEWAPAQVIQALKLLCDIQVYCLHRGIFVETHLWNFVLRKGVPILIDLGDFCPVPQVGTSLIIQGEKFTTISPELPVGRDLITMSILGSFRNKLDNHCPIHMSTFIQNYSDTKENLRKIYNNNNLSLIDKFSLFKEQFEKVENTTRVGTWSDYDKGAWEDISDIPSAVNSKSRVLCEYISDKLPKTILDMGCNTGMYSLYASSHGSTCVGIDTDRTSVTTANASAKDRDLNCIFAVSDIMNPFPRWGIKGVYGSIEDRFKSEMVIAPAIFHHLLMQGHDSNLIIDRLASYSKKYLCLEYIPYENSFSRVPWTWPSEELVVSRLNHLGFAVSLLSSSPVPRKWLLAQKKEVL
jgi:SAM-dependent methyltransferase